MRGASKSAVLWAYGRRFYRHAAGTPHQIKFQVDVFRSAIFVVFRAHPDHTVAKSPLQRTEALPFQSIDRIAGRMRLRNKIASEPLASIVGMALIAGEIELTLAPVKGRSPGLTERCKTCVVGRRDRLAA